jgi:hemolysin activation/secretion protein
MSGALAEETNSLHGPASAVSPAPKTNALTFEVRAYEIHGNSLLSDEALEPIFTNALGKNVSFEQIRLSLSNLQLAYRERGFPTVVVSLPQQQLTNAMIKVQVTEGRLADIRVVNNRHFSSNNVMRALPGVRADVILNSQVFQRELDLANANRDRQIYPLLGPGPEPNTSALTLKVKDRLPLHGRFELNNQATPGTPDLRMNLSAQYNNLWQREHQLGLQYSLTPERLKESDAQRRIFYDEPLVANYSAYYRLPLGNPLSVQSQIDARSFDFGYNEITHQFRLPPVTGRPELSFYGSRSTSDTGVKLDTAQIVTQTNGLTTLSQNSGEDITSNENLGGRLSVPLTEGSTLRGAFFFGLDFKRYRLTSFNTNNFFFITTQTNTDDGTVFTNINSFSSQQPTRHNAVDYLPLAVGFDASIADKSGSSSLSLSANINLPGAFSKNDDFAHAAYSPKAKATYTTLLLGFTREQRICRDWTVLLRANGQVASGALISNEQFGLGGTAGVRGYREGEEYGDNGWRVLFEPRTPLINLGMVDQVLPMWVRSSIFVDYGERYLLESAAGRKPTVRMWGTGFGLTANIGSRYDLRFTAAWPLLDTPLSRAGQPRFYFSIGAQF